MNKDNIAKFINIAKDITIITLLIALIASVQNNKVSMNANAAVTDNNVSDVTDLQSRVASLETRMTNQENKFNTQVGNYKLWVGSQASYNSIGHDGNTIYIIQ